MKRVIKFAAKHVRDHFIPHEGNNHNPYALSHRALLFYSVFLILLKILSVGNSLILQNPLVTATAITPENIIALTNAARQSKSLPQLIISDKLSAAANAKAQDMLLNQYFAHTSPAGVSPWQWFRKFGYNYRYAGENLAVHFSQSEDIQNGWMSSNSHRANILNQRYTEIGVGVSRGRFEGAETIFVVQLFGKPQATYIGQTSNQVIPKYPTSTNIMGATDTGMPIIPKEDIAEFVKIYGPAPESTTPLTAVDNVFHKIFLAILIFVCGAFLLATAYNKHLIQLGVFFHSLVVIGLALFMMLI